MPPRIHSFDHVHVFVADREASERWYAEVLGFTRTEELAFWAPGGGPLTVQNADGTVHLALFERPCQECRSTIALRVGADEFRQWRQHLDNVLGSRAVLEDHEVSWSLYFDDLDGNPFEITTYEVEAAKRSLP